MARHGLSRQASQGLMRIAFKDLRAKCPSGDLLQYGARFHINFDCSIWGHDLNTQ
jgi:hypothetical protein